VDIGVKAGTGVNVGISEAVGRAVAIGGGVQVGGRPIGVEVKTGVMEGPQAERRSGSNIPTRKIFRSMSIVKPVAPLSRGCDPILSIASLWSKQAVSYVRVDFQDVPLRIPEE